MLSSEENEAIRIWLSIGKINDLLQQFFLLSDEMLKIPESQKVISKV